MIATFGTGWLQKDAWLATQPVTYAQILCFDLMVRAGEQVAPWRAEIRDKELADRIGPKLIAGAAIMFHGRLEARPFFERHGVQKGFSRYLEITHVEFSRLPAAADPATAATEPSHADTQA